MEERHLLSSSTQRQEVSITEKGKKRKLDDTSTLDQHSISDGELSEDSVKDGSLFEDISSDFNLTAEDEVWGPKSGTHFKTENLL